MTDDAYGALLAMVNLARDEGIKRLKVLQERLVELGHSQESVQDATAFWANYEAGKVHGNSTNH